MARLRAPSQAELDAIPADRRLELLDLEHQRQERARERRSQSRHQWINSGVLLVGVILAGGSLLATALTLRTGQQELRNAKEGQVTERYTKAVEQLGSGQQEVRAAAVYALERIIADSPRDRLTIRDVLATFVRAHDPAPAVKVADLPAEPDIDVAAALSVLARRPADPPLSPRLDLRGVRVPHLQMVVPNTAEVTIPVPANLGGADLRGADLRGADLAANLNRANLRGADLRGATIRGDLRYAALAEARLGRAELPDADLRGASLHKADLRGVFLLNGKLSGADLSGADLRGVNLVGADLAQANMLSADLRDAMLGDADFDQSDLRGADLRGLRGSDAPSEADIRGTAKVDTSTRF